MPTVVVRYQTKPERAEENQQLIENVFAELNERGDTGFRYVSLRLDDGVSFLHIAIEGSSDPGTSLAQLPAFKAFVSGIGERCEVPPVTQVAVVVGAHGM